MKRISGLAWGAVMILALATGCEDVDGPAGVPTVTAQGRAAQELMARGRLAVYNGDVDRAVPARPCAADPLHRQFDFWIGDWDVTAPGAPTGSTNQIRGELDGCLVSESWTASSGIRGRSLNAYDRDLAQWHQTWVSSQPFGHLRMAGNLEADTLVMRGRRQTQAGAPIFDEYRWHVLPTGQVVQRFTTDVPSLPPPSSGALTYTRAPSVTPPAEVRTVACQPGGNSAAMRQLDFLLGTWTVAAGQGPALGTAAITGDLSGCLAEERYATDKGYEAVSWFYYDPRFREFFRTYIDSEGERVELHGTFADGRLVLTGTEPGRDGRSVQVRVTLAAVSADVVRQEWAVSKDGETWETEMSLVFTRP
jgi:hypothetical protein